jgi:polyhydroxybutyrate depolymerase
VRSVRFAAAALICCGLLVGVSLAVARPARSGGPTPRAASTSSAGVPSGCTPLPAGTVRIRVDDTRIPVVMYIPRGLRPGAPLILGLPGAGQTARDFASYTGYSRLADMKGFAVAYPTASGSRRFWNIANAPGTPNDVAYLRNVIAAALRATCASPARVGVTGVSNGGGMAARLGCDASDLVSAIAPVAGGYGSLPACRTDRPVPVLEIHGLDDEVVPYHGKGPARFGAVDAFLQQWARLNACPSRWASRWVGPKVLELRKSSCAGGSVVVHDRVSDQEHGWPGGNNLDPRSPFSASLATWRFLTAYTRGG